MNKTIKILYINDYMCSDNSIMDELKNYNVPRNHLWGIDTIISGHYKVVFGLIRKCKRFPRINRLIESVRLFLAFSNVQIVYTSLSGYETIFLLAKKLHLWNGKIITVVHHPIQVKKLYVPYLYNKLIFISRETYNQYNSLNYNNGIYLFWGPDINYYPSLPSPRIYDFIACGKTKRDYKLMRNVMNQLGVKYKIYGEGKINNEISYAEAITEYSKSKFICIPLEYSSNTEGILNGLTSLNDALGMGIPVIISDNSNIGIDINNLNLGFVYKAGDELDFKAKCQQAITLSEEDYKRMSNKCLEFAKCNSFLQSFAMPLKKYINELTLN